MKFLIVLSLASLVGCGSVDLKALENRVACAAGKDEAHVISKWGPVGIASKLADQDKAVVCR
jgi:hypothetical protein